MTIETEKGRHTSWPRWYGPDEGVVASAVAVFPAERIKQVPGWGGERGCYVAREITITVLWLLVSERLSFSGGKPCVAGGVVVVQ